MERIYDYNKHISVVTTPNGDKVITTNDAIFTLIINSLYDAQVLANKEGRKFTAEDLHNLWSALYDKSEGVNNETTQ